jgi:hypothetical protein
MTDRAFIFDCVVHRIDMSPENLADGPDTDEVIDSIVTGSRLMQAPQYHDLEYRRGFSVEEMYEMVFVDAPTDMAMVQVVPQFEWFKDLYAPVRLQHEFAEAYPDRVMFCGGVDPWTRAWPQRLSRLSTSSTSSAHVR